MFSSAKMRKNMPGKILQSTQYAILWMDGHAVVSLGGRRCAMACFDAI